jgi:hypothetical protein
MMQRSELKAHAPTGVSALLGATRDRQSPDWRREAIFPDAVNKPVKNEGNQGQTGKPKPRQSGDWRSQGINDTGATTLRIRVA